MKRVLEIACFNLESCHIAQNAGAGRIEFCSNYSIGGITPSREEIVTSRSQIKIPLYIMIRPRGGNYLYSQEEKELMRSNVVFCKQNGVDGIVTGALTEKSTIDKDFIKEIISLAHPLPVTFHRCIDDCLNMEEAVQELAKLGIKRILTSGGGKNVSEGKHKIKELQAAFGNMIVIMPGGGIRSDNISEVRNFTGCTEFHSSAITGATEKPDAMEIKKLMLF